MQKIKNFQKIKRLFEYDGNSKNRIKLVSKWYFLIQLILTRRQNNAKNFKI